MAWLDLLTTWQAHRRYGGNLPYAVSLPQGVTSFRYRFFRKGGEKGAARPRDLLR
jgi:hypothetical protein